MLLYCQRMLCLTLAAQNTDLWWCWLVLPKESVCRAFLLSVFWTTVHHQLYYMRLTVQNFDGMLSTTYQHDIIMLMLSLCASGPGSRFIESRIQTASFNILFVQLDYFGMNSYSIVCVIHPHCSLVLFQFHFESVSYMIMCYYSCSSPCIRYSLPCKSALQSCLQVCCGTWTTFSRHMLFH